MHDLSFLQNMHVGQLAVINNVNFTPREIDIISCLLNMRGTNKIASLLSIAPNTVLTHIHNIIIKLGCNSREGVIDFIEKSHKFPFIKQHYANLTIYAAFEKSLKEISQLNRTGKQVCLSIYGEDQNGKDIFISHLKDHLKQVGISAEILGAEANDEIETLNQKKPNLRLFLSKKDSNGIFREHFEVDFLDISEQSSYYLSVFEILQKLLPAANLSKIITNFKEQYEGLHGFFELKFPINSEEEVAAHKKKVPHKAITFLKNKKGIFLIFLVGIVYFITHQFILRQEMWFTLEKKQVQVQNLKQRPIRSAFVMPAKSSFLDRPELIADIRHKFEKQQDIPIIALVGPGGSGKTTLARQYGSQQVAPAIWEINAETIESLISSFETLAVALAKAWSKQKVLEDIQAITDPVEREIKLLQFVRDKLISYSDWLLIYDNVENFATIKKYFPYDMNSWGKGRVLITTRDNHIKNSYSVSQTLQVGELTPQESLTLFTKIMSHENSFQSDPHQIDKTMEFLSKLPSFPLDISIAAYYLKSVNISYDKYLERLKESGKDFNSIQKAILTEVGGYPKTRYNIITFSLKHLIEAHKDFESLLFLISLLDSQNIPRNLLEAYKNGGVVDNFVYYLKKHSLITNEAPIPSDSMAAFSIHRSTQEIILTYLISRLDLEKRNELLTSISQTLTDYMTSITDEEDLSSIKALLVHYETFLHHHNLLPNDMRSLVEGKLGAMYYSLRHYAKGQKILEKSFEELEKNPASNHLHIINALAYLTTIYMELGNHEEAQNVIENRIMPYKEYFVEVHPHIARALTYLGDACTVLGNYEQAKSFLEQSYKLYQEHFPTHYFWLARTSAFLGNTYVELGEYEKAKSLQEKALLIHKTHVLKNRLDIAWQSTFLANTYEKLGYYAKAKLLLEEAILIAKQYLPENHIDIGWITVFLGNIYRELGQLEKAKITLEETLIVHKETCGKENIRTASVLAALGSVNRDLGQYEKAKDFLNQGLVIYEKEFAKDHIETARILRDLGQTYILESHFEVAETLLSKVLKIFQETQHPESYKTLEILAELFLKRSTQAAKEGNTQLSLTFKDKSVLYLSQALETVKTHFPKDSPQRKKIEIKLQGIQL
ncbi:MAG: tetratricopeptide repeat protein [Alphaproteobacteria bacterium]|nr:tetratricopeptide repeat protein [Alphaproteobacteria bacterium]